MSLEHSPRHILSDSDGRTKQAVAERHLFERRQYTLTGPATNTLYLPEHGTRLLETTTPLLSKHYAWIEGTDPSQVATLMNEIEAYREAYSASQGILPSDVQVYRHYRVQLETATSKNTSEGTSVLLLDALMNGDIMNGTLPEFPTKTRKKSTAQHLATFATYNTVDLRSTIDLMM